MADPATRQGERRLLALELLAESRAKLRFDVDGWVADQRAFLAMVSRAESMRASCAEVRA